MKRFQGCLLLLFIVILLSMSGCGQAGSEKEIPVVIDYYFTPSCDSCNDGETFATELAEKISDVIDEDEYEINLKNVSEPEYYEEFNQLAQQYKTDDFYPNPPVVRVNNQMLFGIDEIQDRIRKVIIEEKNQTMTPQEQVETFNNIDPSTSYLVYFYKTDCPYCEDTEAYMEKMDKIITLQDGGISPLKINYVNISEIENMPLANYFFEKYHVPEDDRKTPVLFYQNGYIRKYENIVKELPNVLNEGEATGWQDIDFVPPSENNLILYSVIAVAVLAIGGTIVFFVRRKRKNMAVKN